MGLEVFVVGLIVGVNSASWGAYKDSPYENFSPQSYLRSIVVSSLVLAPLSYLYITQILKIHAINLGIFMANVYLLERLFTEVFKAFVRREDQTKYKIPSKLHVFGKPVKSNLLRLGVGLIFLIYVWFGVQLPNFVKIAFPSHFISSAFWGFVAGFFGSSIPGCYKDAPIEGFDKLKFFRSAIVGTVIGVVFGFFTHDYVLLGIGVIGMERMVVEFYKSFIYQKVPGKFASTKPLYPTWKTKKKIFIAPYFASWILALSLFFYFHHS